MINVKSIEADLKQVIEVKFKRSKSFQNGLKAVGKKAIELIQRRTNQGLDVNGQRLSALTWRYREFKRLYIQGKRKTRDSRGKFVAKSLPNHGRLSGQLFGSMGWTITNNKVYLVLKNQRAKDKIQWLRSSKGRARGYGYSKASRDIWGIGSNTPRGRKEIEELKKAFIGAL